MTGILIRRKRFGTQSLRGHTEGRSPCDNKGRNWSDAAASQGMPRIAGNHQMLAVRYAADSSLTAPQRNQPC